MSFTRIAMWPMPTMIMFHLQSDQSFICIPFGRRPRPGTTVRVAQPVELIEHSLCMGPGLRVPRIRDDKLERGSSSIQAARIFEHVARRRLLIWSRISSSMPPISPLSEHILDLAAGITTPSMSPKHPVAGIDAEMAESAAADRDRLLDGADAGARLRFDRRHVAREDRPVGDVEEEVAVAHAAVDDDAGRAARLGGGRHQLAPVARLPVAGGRHQHHAARIHALEEIEGRDLGKVGILGVAARVGGAWRW